MDQKLQAYIKYVQERTKRRMSNLTLQACVDIINDYKLTIEDAEMLLRIIKFQEEPCILDRSISLEDVDMDAPVIDPSDINFNTFAIYG